MSDEADRIKAYQDLARRGQPVPGKNFGTGVTPKLKKTPKVKTIDTTKMKQIKLLKIGGATDPLKGVATMLANIEKGKTGVKSVDRQKKKDAAMIKKLKKSAKVSKVKAKPQIFDVTPKPGSALSIQKETITMAKDGGLMGAIEKVKAQEMSGGGEPVPPKFKGFSKLPEKVQEKIDPKLATKYEFGGDVKGKKGRMMCRGMGIARKNKGFKIT